jgi:phage I-like protein
MKKKSPQQIGIAALSVSLGSSASAGHQIQLTPDGTFKARDGRPEGLPGFLLTPEISAQLRARLQHRQNDIVVDYEHQTIATEKNGQPAPAAGWINPQSIKYVPAKGLYAEVKWTDTAARHIANDEYRFLSPVLAYDQATGAVRDILHVALTNFPAVDGMAKVAVEALRSRLHSQTQPEEEHLVNREELITLLGLATDATNEQITAALKAAQTANATIAALRAELELKDSDDAVVAVAALKQNTKPDLTKYAPLEVVEALKGEIAELRNNQSASEVESLIAEALRCGQLVPAQKAWATELGTTNVAALKQYLATTPAVAALRATQTEGKTPAGAAPSEPSGNPDAIAVLKQLGITEEDAAKVTEQENA